MGQVAGPVSHNMAPEGIKVKPLRHDVTPPRHISLLFWDKTMDTFHWIDPHWVPSEFFEVFWSDPTCNLYTMNTQRQSGRLVKLKEVQTPSSTCPISRSIEVLGWVPSSQAPPGSGSTDRAPIRQGVQSEWLWTKQGVDRCHCRTTPKSFESKIRRPLSWLFQNQFKARGLHPLGAPSVHPTDTWNFREEY
jgi:hypothetical protein